MGGWGGGRVKGGGRVRGGGGRVFRERQAAELRGIQGEAGRQMNLGVFREREADELRDIQGEAGG